MKTSTRMNDQGKAHTLIRAKVRTANSVAEIKPVRSKTGKVTRKYDCRFYLECLGKAAIPNRATVPCEGCPDYEPIDMFSVSEGDMPGVILLFRAIFNVEVSGRGYVVG